MEIFGSVPFSHASYFQFYSPSSGVVLTDVTFFKKSHWCCDFTRGYQHYMRKPTFNFAQWRYTNQWPYREVVLLLVENWIPIPRLEDVKYHLSCQFLMVLLETNNDVAKIPNVLCIQLHTKYVRRARRGKRNVANKKDALAAVTYQANGMLKDHHWSKKKILRYV